jgi:transcription elongation factor S-II
MTTVDIPVVFLGQKGEIRQGKLKSTSSQSLAAAFKKKEVPALLGKYVYKQKVLFLFGYLEGKANQENQHHLPAPLEGITFFGDILVLASTSAVSYETAVPLKTADYETFYTAKLEGEDEDEIDEDEKEEVVDVVEEVLEDESEKEEEYMEGGDDNSEANIVNDDDVYDDDDAPAILIEKPTRVSKKKIAAVISEEPEIELSDDTTTVPIRQKVLQVINKSFELSMDHDARSLLESILFNTTFEEATKNNVRKSWGNSAFCDMYLAAARRVVGNLSDTSYVKNKNLWQRYVANELTLEQIVKQHYYELCPEKWQVMVDKQAKMERIQLEGDFSRATDKWQCNGCKMRKCTYYELQTRSADEPMTIFIHCLNCGKRWTQ